MMQPHPRPGRPRRPSIPHNDAGIDLSNSTASRFLGGPRKSWMQNSGAVLPNSPPAVIHRRTYPTPPASSVDTRINDAVPSSLSVPAVSSSSPVAVALPSPAQSHDAPAPTDGQSLALPSSSSRPTSTLPVWPDQANNDNASPAGFAGDAANTTPVTAGNVIQNNIHGESETTNEVAPSLHQPTSNIRPHFVAETDFSNGHRKANSDVFSPRPSDSHRDKRVRMDNNQPSTLPKRDAYPAATSTAFTTTAPGTGNISNAPLPHPSQQPVRSATRTSTTPSNENVSRSHQPGTHSTNPNRQPGVFSSLATSLQSWKVGLPPSAVRRVALLQDACRSEDIQFLAIHQVFTLSAVSPAFFQSLDGWGPSQKNGLQTLESLLIPNSSLPLAFVQQCSRFPSRIEELCQHNQSYRALFHHLIRSLALIAARWAPFERAILSRRIPPLIDEMYSQFEVQSPILLRVMFTAFCRLLRGVHADKWKYRYMEIFDINMNFYLQRLRQTGSSNPVRPQADFENGHILAQYSKVLMDIYNEGQTDLSGPPKTVSASSLMLDQPIPGTHVGSEQRPIQQPGRTAPAPSNNFPRTAPPHTAQHGPIRNGLSTPDVMQPNGAVPVATTAGNEQTSVQGASRQPPVQQNTSYVQFQQPGQPASATPPNAPPYFRWVYNRPSAGGLRPAIAGSGSQQPPSTGTVTGQQVSQFTAAAVSRQQALPSRAAAVPRQHQSIPAAVSGQQVPSSSAAPNLPSAPSDIPLFPAAGVHLPERRAPDPYLTGLHDAHLMTSTRNLDQSGKNEAPSRRLYQYHRGFALSPVCLGNQMSTYEWTINVSADLYQKLAKRLARPENQPAIYGVIEGSSILQLRCVKVNSPTESLPEQKWSELDSAWPDAIYIYVNGVEHYVRRKVHHGKDLPVNITGVMREGSNKIKVAYLRSPVEFTKVFYAVAAELLEVAEHDTVRAGIQVLSHTTSLERIGARLEKSSFGDEELSIVDDQVSISLVDPFMARVFNTPVRATTCTHWECFDLETYLNTRLAATDSGSGMAEAWKCPICGRDARPTRIFIDEFLVNVRAELEKRNQLEATKAIVVKRDRTWQPKVEANSRQDNNSKSPSAAKTEHKGDGDTRTQNTGGRSLPSPNENQPEIIELD